MLRSLLERQEKELASFKTAARVATRDGWCQCERDTTELDQQRDIEIQVPLPIKLK